MHPRQFAYFGGIVLTFFGLVAFLPALSTPPDVAGLPILNFESSYGLFLGFFPMNLINKIALIAFGLTGIYSANQKLTSLPASITWARWVFVVMGVAAVLGLIPATRTFFGVWPLFGGEVVAHAVFAALGLYFGFLLSSRAMEENHRRFPESQKRAS